MRVAAAIIIAPAAHLKDRGVGGVIATDTNLLYLSNGLPGEMFGFLPTRDDEDFTSILT